ncbi:MAG: 4-hydroxy-3-methylbut-2-enyl diphosphate reductase [Acidimicrobiales bacterium]
MTVRPNLAILTALRLEARAVRGAAVDAEVVVTGMGPERSAAAVPMLVTHPASAIAVAGFAGGLESPVSPGDLVVASEIRGDGSPVVVPSAPLLVAELRRAGLPAHLGPIVSTAKVAGRRDRARLAASGAIAVDMEAWHLAAGAAGRPFAVVRAVVDTPGHELCSLGTPGRSLLAVRSLRRAVPVVETWARANQPRRVLLAGPRSFCAGVERAIDIVGRCLDRFGAPVYVRRQIVHNRTVVQGLEQRGAVFVEELDEVPDDALVVFAAHGVAPSVRAEADRRGLRTVDATCPLVAKVHAETRQFSRDRYHLVLIGHAEHEEVVGTLGEAERERPTNVTVVGSVEEARAVDVADPNRVAYLTQTTLAVDEVSDIIEALRARFPTIAGPRSDDICYATQNRQQAVKALAAESDLVLVVGSTNSSNSNRLVEVARREGCDAHLLEDEGDLELAWMDGVSTVTITAGASAPPVLVGRVVTALATIGPVEVEERQVVTETVRFSLPREVR